jgi:hypothetical protein
VVSIIACQDTLLQTCVFTSGGICGSHSAFQCIWSTKHRHTIFHARLGSVWFPWNAHQTCYTKLVFFHPVGSAGHIVNSGASVPQNINVLFFMLRWDWCRFNKKHAGTLHAKHVFWHPGGSAGHVVHSGAFGARNVNVLFFMIGSAGVVFINSERRHVTPNLCFCIRWDL